MRFRIIMAVIEGIVSMVGACYMANRLVGNVKFAFTWDALGAGCTALFIGTLGGMAILQSIKNLNAYLDAEITRKKKELSFLEGLK